MRALLRPDGVTISCRNGSLWPPKTAWGQQEPAVIRSVYGEADYNRHLVWKRDCGLLQMNLERCMGCPLVLVDGKSTVPARTILPPFMLLSKPRKS